MVFNLALAVPAAFIQFLALLFKPGLAEAWAERRKSLASEYLRLYPNTSEQLLND